MDFQINNNHYGNIIINNNYYNNINNYGDKSSRIEINWDSNMTDEMKK